jgi:DNA-binding beta-propeller fold protein YncE
VDTAGTLVVADLTNDVVQILPSEERARTPPRDLQECTWRATGDADPLVDPQGVALDAYGNVYVAASGRPCVSVLDLLEGRRLTYDLDHAPDSLALTPDGKALYVTSGSSNLIWVMRIKR